MRLIRRLVQPLASAAALSATLLLVACGGGGGGGDTVAGGGGAGGVPRAPAASAFAPSATLANICTLDGQQKYVRSFLDETYLWYDEIVEVKASDFSTVPAYFNALLVRTPDATGQPRDRFSAVLTSAGANALKSVPQDVLAAVSGVPSNLLAATSKSVPLTRVVTSSAGRKVGYILFNEFNDGAQDALITSFETLRANGVADLVLDLRYNAGGFLYMAQTAASLVTGPQSEGKTFEQLRYNNKRQAETTAANYVFSSRVQTPEAAFPRGSALPQLNLPRLYVLTSGQTCSASESIINSLRGIDVEVVLVGGTTCGKPYGFTRKDNCGLAFFALEFQGYNAKNFGDFSGGFKATCPVADNFTTALGSNDEPLLAAALHHIDTGSCPAPAASKSALMQSLPGARAREFAPLTPQSPFHGRLLRADPP